MVEVIDLLGSSPVKPRRQQPEIVCLLSDDDDGDDDMPSTFPSSSPVPKLNRNKQTDPLDAPNTVGVKRTVSNSLGDEFDVDFDMTLTSDEDDFTSSTKTSSTARTSLASPAKSRKIGAGFSEHFSKSFEAFMDKTSSANGAPSFTLPSRPSNSSSSGATAKPASKSFSLPQKKAAITSSVSFSVPGSSAAKKPAKKSTAPPVVGLPKFVAAKSKSTGDVTKTASPASMKELKEANRKRNSHRDTKHELTMFLDEKLTRNPKMAEALEYHRVQLGVPAFKYANPTCEPGCEYSTITFDRHVTCVYNTEKEHFDPVPHHTKKEDYVVVVFTAKEIIRLSEHAEGVQIFERLRKSEGLCECSSVVLLTLGLDQALQKYVNAYKLDIHKKTEASANRVAYTPKDKKVVEKYEKVGKIQQFMHMLYLNLKFRPVDFQTETLLAEYICQIHLGRSLQPYRRKQELYSSDKKSYKDKQECLVSMLDQQKRINPRSAINIGKKFKSAQALMRSFETSGANLLQGIPSSDSRAMGKITSEYIYQIFTCRDPNKLIFPAK